MSQLEDNTDALNRVHEKLDSLITALERPKSWEVQECAEGTVPKGDGWEPFAVSHFNGSDPYYLLWRRPV